MRKRLILAVLAALLPSSLLANTLYFPQAAYGGGYSTTFTIVDTGTTSASGQLIVYSQAGAQLAVFQIALNPSGSGRYEVTSNLSSVGVAWGMLSVGSATVQGVATFEYRNSGTLVTSAGVIGTEGGNSFLLPVDISPSSSTGIALANVNAGTSVSVRLRLLNAQGVQVASLDDANLNPLGARRQIARFVHEFFPQMAGTTFKGALVVEAGSTAPAGSLALTALTVKEGLLSALPVFATAGTSSGGGAGVSPFQDHDVTIEGTMVVSGRTLSITILSSVAEGGFSFAQLDNFRQSFNGTVVYIYFGNPVVSGNTVIFNGVQVGTYTPTTGSPAGSVTSGKLAITASSGAVGTPATGTVQFLTSTQNISTSFSGTIVRSQ